MTDVAESSSDFEERFRVGRAELCWLFGVSYNHVGKLVAKGLPQASRGRYDLRRCVAWWIDYKSTGVDVDELPELVEARRRYITAQARRTELASAREERDVLPADDVASAFLQLLQTLVSAVDGLPMRIAHDLVNVESSAEVVHRSRPHAYAVREQLCEHFGTLAADMGIAADGLAPATKAERGRVGGRGASRAAGESAPRAVAD